MTNNNPTAPFFAVEIAKYGNPEYDGWYLTNKGLIPCFFQNDKWSKFNNSEAQGITHYFTQTPPKEVVEEYLNSKIDWEDVYEEAIHSDRESFEEYISNQLKNR